MQTLLQELSETIGSISGILNSFFLVLCVLFGVIILVKTGDLLSDSSKDLATNLGIPPILVGLTVVSIATSAPELFTSISAIKSNVTGLVLGNIIGSNIANIGLILGVSLLVRPIVITEKIPLLQRVTLLIVSAIFSGYIYFSPNHSINWKFGTILLIFIFLYTIYICYEAIRGRYSEKKDDSHREDQSDTAYNPITSIILIILSAIGLWLGSETLVFGAKTIALKFSIPEELIGFSVVAVGTSLPELAASISLIKNSQTSMLFGNIIGSNLFNMALVGGVSGILAPIKSDVQNPWIDHISMLFLTLFFFIICNQKKLGKKHGLGLLCAYSVLSFYTWFINA